MRDHSLALPFHPVTGITLAITLAALALTAEHYKTSAWNTGLALAILVNLGVHVYHLGGGLRAIRVAAALTARMWITLISYRFQAILLLGQVAIFILVLITMSKPIIEVLFGPVGDAMSAYTQTNYVVYLLLGLAAWPTLWRSYQVASTRIRQEQYTGLFEALVPTPAGAESLPLAYLASALVGSLVSLTGILAAFTYLLPDHALRLADPTALLFFATLLALSVATMWGLGLLIGGLTTLFKEAGSASNLLRFVLILFAGIYVPIEILPDWAEPVSKALPLTYTFEAVRGVLSNGDALTDHLPAVGILAFFALAASTGGMWAYRRLLNHARKAGTLYGY